MPLRASVFLSPWPGGEEGEVKGNRAGACVWRTPRHTADVLGILQGGGEEEMGMSLWQLKFSLRHEARTRSSSGDGSRCLRIGLVFVLDGCGFGCYL